MKKLKNQRDANPVSNEKVTPSFTFAWDSSKKPVKPPFARKRNKVNSKRTVLGGNKDAVGNDRMAGENDSQETHTIKAGTSKQSRQVQNEIVDDTDISVNVISDDEPQFKAKSKFKFHERDVGSASVHSSLGKSVSEKVFSETGQKFNDLSIHKHIISNLEKIGFTDVTNVQEKAIPVVMTGKDVLIRSQTGSGKTLAYAVPIVSALHGITPKLRRIDGVQALIVVPTRELALQTHELFSKINTFQWVVVGHLCGGEKRKTEKDRLRKGVNVLIGTPGRLLDHLIHTSALKVNNVRCLVIDEADRLLEMGFRKDAVKLIEELDRAKTNAEYDPLKLLKKQHGSEADGEEDPQEDCEEFPLKNINSNKRQTILLSATLTKQVTELAEFTMKDHIFVDALDDKVKSTINSESFIIPDTVKQEYIITTVKHRLFTLAALILTKSKQANSKIFVFMASSQMVDFHYELFTKYLVYLPKSRSKRKPNKVVIISESDIENSEVDEEEEEEEEEVLDTEFFKLHGSMDQKMRKEVFTSFRAAKKGVLLCTDVAARGLDVPTADYIVQYNGPQTDDDYVHRVGRTGRAGQAGAAILFLTPEEEGYLSRLREHKVFLKKRNPEHFLNSLSEVMEEPDHREAGQALQRRFESVVIKDRELYRQACFAYSSWSRFYNSYPGKMRTIFNFKGVNLGHYATSFALRDPPSHIAKIVRGQVSHLESPKLNSKLNIHKEDTEDKSNMKNKEANKKRSTKLIFSEFDSGLEPVKKKKKKNPS